MKFSANLGFLWRDLPLPDAIRAAHRAGFDAVECHYPYDTPAALVREALEETGLPMLGLNTRLGGSADFGLSALPDRVDEARAAIDEAIAYADAIQAAAIHVVAGKPQGPEAHKTYLSNLQYACSQTNRTILIEPLNAFDVPGYFLANTSQAKDIIAENGAKNLMLMFDCYHVARTEKNVIGRLKDLVDIIGHIQFAASPNRTAPAHDDPFYRKVFKTISDLGWTRPIGAEYKTESATEDTLGWMKLAP